MSDVIEIFLKELNTKLKQRHNLILAIDGECASLKSTLALALQKKLGAGVVHCDNFYLPAELRTPERLSEAGGNIDYVRMKSEVVEKLKEPGEITYQPFDCHLMKLADAVSVQDARLMIVEGAYAMHPYFGRYYDMSLFLCAAMEERLQRIAKRGQDTERFRERWIPLENRYFDAYKIRERADYIIDTTDISGLENMIRELEV